MEIKTTKESQSIADYLIRLMPNLELRLRAKPMVDPLAAKTLFAIWKDEGNRVKDGVYRRPDNVSKKQIEAINKEGLAQINGDKLQITEKGANIIKVMVLGDNSSVFDKSDDMIIDYAEALKNTKNASVRRGKGLQKKASSDWWNRYE